LTIPQNGITEGNPSPSAKQKPRAQREAFFNFEALKTQFAEAEKLKKTMRME
jgi:hypothetical protein